MFDSAYFAWRFRCLKWLRALLIGGAALSFYLASSLALRPGATISPPWIGAPERPLYLWLPALLLVAMGFVYLLAATDTRRFSPMIAVAVGVQLALALAFFAAAQSSESARLLRLSGAELLVGLGLLLFWWPLRS